MGRGEGTGKAVTSGKRPSLEEQRAALFREGSKFLPAKREDIAGMEHVLERVDEIIDWLKNAREYMAEGSRLEPGVVAFGEPGTGKTLTARFTASESGAIFVNVREFPHADESMTADDVGALFAHARRAYKEHDRPVLLFWDEFEAHARHRSMLDQAEADVVARLTEELDGLNGKNEGVLLVGATNYFHEIDGALLRPGRMGVHLSFTAPSRAGKAQILSLYLSRVKTDGEIDVEMLSWLFESNASAAEIEEAVAEAWRLSVARKITEKAGEAVLREDDLIEVFLRRMIGARPSSSDLAPRMKERVELHESGHALAATIFGVPLQLVTTRIGEKWFGRTVTSTFESEEAMDPESVIREMYVACGGLVFERILGGGESRLGEDDTGRLSELAREVIEQTGASTVGLISPDGYRRGREEMSEDLRASLDRDIVRLVKAVEQDVVATFTAIDPEQATTLVSRLHEEETMSGRRFADCVTETIGHIEPAQQAVKDVLKHLRERGAAEAAERQFEQVSFAASLN